MTRRDGPVISRRSACFALIAAAAVQRAAAQAVPPAEQPYQVLDMAWEDASRQRAVPVRLYLPSGEAAVRPLPLMVFSHGIGGSRANYSYLGRHWASHGVASLHVQHVGSDRSVWGGSLLGVVGRLRTAATEAEAVQRVHDLRFALDRLLAADTPVPDLQVDAQRIVAAGHSYGANTVLLAIGARVRRDGQWRDFRDRRFSAAVILSAPPFYGEADLPAILSPVAVPTLHVTCTEDVIRIPGMYSGVEDRIAVYDAMPDPRKALVMYQGGSHSIFTDRAGTGGLQLNPQIKAATRELSLAFVQQSFGSDPSALHRWGQSWQALVARSAGVNPTPA
jgi:predicted dienelactone hydrolase